MKTKQRWLNAVIAEADKCDTQMPWERGARRKEMIARRLAKLASEDMSQAA
jgi:hypothetical protein